MQTWQFWTLMGFLVVAFRMLFGGLSAVLEPMLDRAKAVDEKLGDVVKLLKEIESHALDIHMQQPKAALDASALATN
jgi:hypothetical protein